VDSSIGLKQPTRLLEVRVNSENFTPEILESFRILYDQGFKFVVYNVVIKLIIVAATIDRKDADIIASHNDERKVIQLLEMFYG